MRRLFLLSVVGIALVFAFTACGASDDACDGITCDEGYECVDGECVAIVVDPCEGVECDEGFECVEGECVEVV